MRPEIGINLWDADLYGDGTSKGFQLTAYLLGDEGVITDKYVSVPVTRADLGLKMADTVDDGWYYPGSRKHIALLTLLVAKQIERNK